MKPNPKLNVLHNLQSHSIVYFLNSFLKAFSDWDSPIWQGGIPHDLLIAKLEAYGLDTCALKLVYSYLTNRKQRVKVGSAYSTFQSISTGVPQGSVLGPLLFNIFINDLFFTDLESEICNFADDTTIYACDTSIDAVTIKLKDNLQKLPDWFKNNGMCANPAKFQMMFLGLKSDNSFILDISGQQVKQSEQVKLLGVQIDNSLTFDAHVKELCRNKPKIMCILKNKTISQLRES